MLRREDSDGTGTDHRGSIPSTIQTSETSIEDDNNLSFAELNLLFEENPDYAADALYLQLKEAMDKELELEEVKQEEEERMMRDSIMDSSNNNYHRRNLSTNNAPPGTALLNDQQLSFQGETQQVQGILGEEVEEEKSPMFGDFSDPLTPLDRNQMGPHPLANHPYPEHQTEQDQHFQASRLVTSQMLNRVLQRKKSKKPHHKIKHIYKVFAFLVVIGFIVVSSTAAGIVCGLGYCTPDPQETTNDEEPASNATTLASTAISTPTLAPTSSTAHSNIFNQTTPNTVALFPNITVDSSTTILDLSNRQLTGTLPIQQIILLTDVQSIHLNQNSLSGPIPTEILLLTQLTSLNLADNDLTGPIPRLTQVQAIQLSNNRLNGSIPARLGNQIQFLDISNNQLTGQLPTELGWKQATSNRQGTNQTSSSSALEVLRLNANQLQGEIPNQWGRLTQLKVLELQDNILSGTVPGGVCELPNLETIEVDTDKVDCCCCGRDKTNNVSMVVECSDRLVYPPAETGQVELFGIPYSTQEPSLNFQGSQLLGTVPTAIGFMTNLISLRLGDNELTGPIPTELGLITKLTYLDLSRNTFEGATMPSELGLLSELTSLILDKSRIDGPIPTEIGLMKSMQVLKMGGNNLIGTIPTEMGLLTNLNTIKLSENNLESTIPSELAQLTQLASLRLTGNDFVGTVDERICQLVFEFALDFVVVDDTEMDCPESCCCSHPQGKCTYENPVGDDIIQTESPTWAPSLRPTLAPVLNQTNTTNTTTTLLEEHNNVTEINTPQAIDAYNSTTVDDDLPAADDTNGTELVSSPAPSGPTNETEQELETAWPSPSPSFSLSPIAPQVLTLLLAKGPFGDAFLNEPESPQHAAFAWLLENSDLEFYSDEKIIQRYALAVLYHSTNGGAWLNSDGWLTDQDECTWYSHSSSPCNSDRELAYLSLVSNNLQGSLVAELGMLTSLTALSLMDDNLEGTMPSTLGLLSALESLELKSNSHSGTLPEEIANLSQLQRLDIESNLFSGSIPEFLASMTKLLVLNFSSNHFTGSIPRALGDLTQLTELRLNANKLSGTIPSWLGLLTKLTILSFDDNNLHGEVPQNVCLLALSFDLEYVGIGEGDVICPSNCCCEEGMCL